MGRLLLQRNEQVKIVKNNLWISVMPYRNRLLVLLLFMSVIVFSWVSLTAGPDRRAESEALATHVKRPVDKPSPEWMKELDGFVVWSSDRSGEHNIWHMSLPDMRIRPLTNDPHTENFARISPDGKQIVFGRAHNSKQSLRDDTNWDVWILNIETGEEELIAKWGMSPSWSPDGSFILFQRNPGKIIAVDLKSRKEHIYYASGNDSLMKSRNNLATPSIGEGQRMAFTFRDLGRPTNVIRDARGEMFVISRESCQALWSPSGAYLTYIDDGGKQKNQVFRYDPDTRTSSVLLDLPGDYSHEYFARLSRDEKYMILAASDDGHEHDLEDYELFLWPVGAQPAQAARLTFDSGNDSWPDLKLN